MQGMDWDLASVGKHSIKSFGVVKFIVFVLSSNAAG